MKFDRWSATSGAKLKFPNYTQLLNCEKSIGNLLVAKRTTQGANMGCPFHLWVHLATGRPSFGQHCIIYGNHASNWNDFCHQGTTIFMCRISPITPHTMDASAFTPWALWQLLPLGKMVAICTDDTFRCIFVNEKFCILIKIWLKFVPYGPFDNKPVLV